MPKVPTEPLPPLTTRGTVRKNRLYTPEENIQKGLLLIRNGVYMARAARIASVPLKRLEARVKELRESGELDLYWGKNAPRYLEQLEAEEEESQNEIEEATPNSATEKKEKQKRQVRHWNYTAEDVENAAKAVRQGLYSINAAHNVYKVSRRAIKLVLQGEPAEGRQTGPGNFRIRKRGKLRAEEEQAVIDYAMALHKLKHPVNVHSMVPCARQLLKRRQLTLKETYGWWSGFKNRHKAVGELCTHPKEVKSYSRERWVKLYFDRLMEVYDAHNFNVKPSRIYACEFIDLIVERWMTSSKPEGIRLIKVDILVAANATGYHVLPPCVVYRNDTETIPDFLGLPEAGFVFAEEGRVTGAILLEWFRTVFLRYLPARTKEDPIILIMQGSNSLLSAELVSLAQEEHVQLVLMNTEVLQLLSPLVILLQELRSTYRTKLEEFMISNRHLHLEIKEPFYPVTLRNIFATTFNMSEIQEAFKIKGVFPLNPDNVDPTCPVDIADEKSDKPVSKKHTPVSTPILKYSNVISTAGPIAVPGTPVIPLPGLLPLSPLTPAPAIPIAIRQANPQPQVNAEVISGNRGVSVNPPGHSAAVPVTSATFTKGTPEPESNLASSANLTKLSKAFNADVLKTILIVKKQLDNQTKVPDTGRDSSSPTGGYVPSPTGGRTASQTTESATIPSEVIVPFELATAPDTTSAPSKVTNEPCHITVTTTTSDTTTTSPSKVTSASSEVTNATSEVTDAAMEVIIESDEVVDLCEVTNINSEVANVISEISNVTGEVNDAIIEVTIASNEVIVESDEVTTACSEVTNSAGEVTNTSNAVTNTTGEVTNTTSKVTNTTNEVTNVTGEVTNGTMEVAVESDEVMDTSSEVISNPSEVTIASVKVTNEAGKVTNISNKATTDTASREVTNEVCEVTIESDEESSGSCEVICVSSQITTSPSSVTSNIPRSKANSVSASNTAAASTAMSTSNKSLASVFQRGSKSQKLLSLFTEMCEKEVRRDAGNSQDSSPKANDGSSSSELPTASGTSGDKAGSVPQSVIDSSVKATDGSSSSSSSSELATRSGTSSDKAESVPQSAKDSSQKATDSSSSELPTPSETSIDYAEPVPQSVIDRIQSVISQNASLLSSLTAEPSRPPVPPSVKRTVDSRTTTTSSSPVDITVDRTKLAKLSKAFNADVMNTVLAVKQQQQQQVSCPAEVRIPPMLPAPQQPQVRMPLPTPQQPQVRMPLPTPVFTQLSTQPTVPITPQYVLYPMPSTQVTPVLIPTAPVFPVAPAAPIVIRTVTPVASSSVVTPMITGNIVTPAINAPAVASKTVTPAVTTETGNSAVASKTVAPAVTTEIGKSLVASKTVTPVVTTETGNSAVASKTVTPVATNETGESTVASKKVTQMVTDETGESAVASKTVTATVTNETGESAVASKTVTPMVTNETGIANKTVIATVTNETGQSAVASKTVTPVITNETGVASKTVTAMVTNETGQSVVASKRVTPVVTNKTGVASKTVTSTVTNETGETSVTPVMTDESIASVVITSKTVTPEVTSNTNSTTKQSCSHATPILLRKKKAARDKQDVVEQHEEEQNKNQAPNQKSISPSSSSKNPEKQNNQSVTGVKRTARKQSIVTSDPDSNKDRSPDVIEIDANISSDSSEDKGSDINREDQCQSHDNIKEAKDKSCDISEKDKKCETVSKGDEKSSTSSGRESRRRKAPVVDIKDSDSPTSPKKARTKVESDATSTRRTRAMTKEMSPIRMTRSMKK